MTRELLKLFKKLLNFGQVKLFLLSKDNKKFLREFFIIFEDNSIDESFFLLNFRNMQFTRF